jgi:hypothetical protein
LSVQLPRIKVPDKEYAPPGDTPVKSLKPPLAIRGVATFRVSEVALEGHRVTFIE